MNRGPYSKISKFNMITILTKAFINSYEIPKDRNDYCRKNINNLTTICNIDKKITIKKEYKEVLNKFIKNFNSLSFKNICMLTKYNLFPFLMVIAEICKYTCVYIETYSYIPELQDELEKIKKNLKNAIKENNTLKERKLTKEKEEKEKQIEKLIDDFNKCLKGCLSTSVNDIFFCNYFCNNLNVSSFIESFSLEEKLKLLDIILVLSKKIEKK